jgi:hypothetical protein
MKTSFKSLMGLKSAAFVLFVGVMAANCSSKSNPAPDGGDGKGGKGGTTGTAGTGGSTAGTGGSTAGTGGSTAGAGGSIPDGGVGDAGDASCPPGAIYPADAGCMACAADPLLSCGRLPLTCIPFTGTVPNLPKL